MPPELQLLHNSASMQYLQVHPLAAQTSLAQMQAAHQASLQRGVQHVQRPLCLHHASRHHSPLGAGAAPPAYRAP